MRANQVTNAVGNIRRILNAVASRVVRPYHLWRVRHAPEYREPTAHDLSSIEGELRGLKIPIVDYSPAVSAFDEFVQKACFPPDYHGGEGSGVYREKLLEHFVAWDLLGLGTNAVRQPYIDVAGAASPWAKILRGMGVAAFSIDLEARSRYSGLDYYLQQDATATTFGASEIGSASLQCAFEMFAGDADSNLITELARILKTGGRAVISPLYMHTHACVYQTPEYYGRVAIREDVARYVRRNSSRVPVSRKYSARTLVTRVIEPAIRAGLRCQLLALRNKEQLGNGIYLHFILVIDKE